MGVTYGVRCALINSVQHVVGQNMHHVWLVPHSENASMSAAAYQNQSMSGLPLGLCPSRYRDGSINKRGEKRRVNRGDTKRHEDLGDTEECHEETEHISLLTFTT